MQCFKVRRILGVVAATFAISGLASPATAQSARAQIQLQVKSLANDNPGSALVYAGCRTAAESEYRDTRSVESALGALTVCAGLGCALTDSYSNCLSVNAQLFLLELRLA